MISDKPKTVIVVPTYNEKDNITNLLNRLLKISQVYPHADVHTLVVDDSSPDGTGTIVEEYDQHYENIHLLVQKKKGGLGKAYIEGFKYAINKLKADIIFEMDADLSHNPDDVPAFIDTILEGNDFVIGSRYVQGGSIPSEWPLLRKLNSKVANIVARFIAGLYTIKDCTSGFRAIKASLINTINLNELGVKGYAFQMNLLHAAYKKAAKIKEVPIQFTDRVYGKSKLRFSDIREFILNAFYIRFPFLKSVKRITALFIFAAILVYTIYYFLNNDTNSLLSSFIVGLSIFLFLQSAFNIFTMLYAWEDIEETQNNKSPAFYAIPRYSFTALVPARHEDKVIAETIRSLANMDYPQELMEILVICRQDDTKTILKAQEQIDKLGVPNIRLITFYDFPINKPHSLNIGLMHATKDVVAIFDAEDSPHKQLFNIVNTVMIAQNSDVVQSGVQLMNWNSKWFSALNVLEYYFWFKSSLHFFAKLNALPLGGNTVFFKKSCLEKVGGWDEECLTEDADIGLRMSLEGNKISVIYDEEHVTKEETPTDVASFIKQRTRWNQGFFQIFGKGDWLKLPTFTQRLLFLYILLMPLFQSILLVLVPISLYIAFTVKISVVAAMLTFIPLVMLLLQFIIYNIGLYEFMRDYKQQYSVLIPFKLALNFFPYQFILGLGAFRAVYRMMVGAKNWEKTLHINAHRYSTQQNTYVKTVGTGAWLYD